MSEKKIIVVVDDNLQWRKTYRRVIESLDFGEEIERSPLVFESADDFLNWLPAVTVEKLALVILDGLNGKWLLISEKLEEKGTAHALVSGEPKILQTAELRKPHAASLVAVGANLDVATSKDRLEKFIRGCLTSQL